MSDLTATQLTLYHNHNCFLIAHFQSFVQLFVWVFELFMTEFDLGVKRVFEVYGGWKRTQVCNLTTEK